MIEWDVAFERGETPDGRPVLLVAGEIDLAVAPRLARELEDLVGRANDVAVLDLSGVGFMDSSGIRELLRAKLLAHARDATLVLRGPSDACRNVLEVSGAWAEFEVYQADT
jgi:anti-sigma B factor antagonist